MRPTARSSEDRADDDVEIALPDDPSAPTLARSVVRETLTRWGLPELIDNAELAVSELVTNAYKHALPPVSLRLSQRACIVRMDVSDMRPATETVELPIPSEDCDESGRGRGIIAAVSDHSGTEQPTGAGQSTSSYASWDVENDAKG